ncbi:hypothetical protein AN1V17_17290 [Vallitalea sediminicola]
MMERILYMGLNKFKNNILSKIIIILELVLIIYLLNVMIGMWRHYTYVLDMVKDMNIEKSYHISEYKGSKYEDKDYTVGELEKSETTDGLEVMIYNDSIIKNIHLPLSKGIWFTEYSDEEIPIILSYSYAKTYKLKIGDIIEKELNNKDFRKKINCKVIGILSKQNYYFNLSVTSSELKWNNLFVAYEEVGIINSNELITYPEKPKIIFMEKEQKNKSVIIDELSKHGLITSSSKLTENTKNQLSYKLREQLIMWILLLSLIIATLTSNNMLEKIYEEKEFAIYYMLGLSWANCIIIEIIRSITHVLIASILAAILIGFTYNQNAYKSLIMDGYNYLISAGVILVIYMTSSLWIVIELLKTNPVDLIRRNE